MEPTLTAGDATTLSSKAFLDIEDSRWQLGSAFAKVFDVAPDHLELCPTGLQSTVAQLPTQRIVDGMTFLSAHLVPKVKKLDPALVDPKKVRDRFSSNNSSSSSNTPANPSASNSNSSNNSSNNTTSTSVPSASSNNSSNSNSNSNSNNKQSEKEDEVMTTAVSDDGKTKMPNNKKKKKTPGKTSASWQYQEQDDEWKEFDAKINQSVEFDFAKKRCSTQFDVNGSKYTINLYDFDEKKKELVARERFFQQNMSSGTVRTVRRELLAEGPEMDGVSAFEFDQLEVPSFLEELDEYPQLLKQWKAFPMPIRVPIKPSDKLYKEATASFLQTMSNSTIEKVEAVFNPLAYAAYRSESKRMLQRERLRQGVGDWEKVDVDERWLFHGTKYEVLSLSQLLVFVLLC